MRTTRDTKRPDRRAPRRCPSVAIAGYTNAGKSSLLNRLTGAGVLVEDALFATLDPTTRQTTTLGRPDLHAVRHRRLRPAPAAPAGRGVPLDAGGGRRLRPDPARGRRRRTPTRRASWPRCARCFAEIGADKVPELVVINKADVADPMVLARLRHARAALGGGVRPDRGGHRRGCCVAIECRAAATRARPSRRCCPTSAATWSRGSTRRGEVLAEEHLDTGTRLRACRPRAGRCVVAVH